MAQGFNWEERRDRIGQDEVACVVAALNATREVFGSFVGLPGGALHSTGGLSPETAAMVEGVIRQVVDAGVADPSVARVMAEMDVLDRIHYRSPTARSRGRSTSGRGDGSDPLSSPDRTNPSGSS